MTCKDRSPWGREIKEDGPRSPWGREIAETRTNPWGRTLPETRDSDQPADAASEDRRPADQLVAELAEAYSQWAGVNESEAAGWAVDIAKYHLDKVAARAGSEEDYLQRLRDHAADISRRTPLTERSVTAARLRPTVKQIREVLRTTEQKKG